MSDIFSSQWLITSLIMKIPWEASRQICIESNQRFRRYRMQKLLRASRQGGWCRILYLMQAEEAAPANTKRCPNAGLMLSTSLSKGRGGRPSKHEMLTQCWLMLVHSQQNHPAFSFPYCRGFWLVSIHI